MTSPISDERIAAALRASKGNILDASKRLKCSRTILYTRIKRNEEFQAIIEEGRESRIDIAESKLDAAVKAGNMRAIELTLRTIGRKRGYNLITGITGEDGGPVVVKVLKGEASLDDL